MPSLSQLLLPAVAVFIGYLLGSISFAVIVARRHGVDILKAGSGNPGATNVKRVCGRGPGNLVFALDMLKGALASGWPWVAAQVLPALLADFSTVATWAPGAVLCAQLCGFVGAVLGHCFSVFLGFRGGKGVAVSAGGLLGAIPLCFAVSSATWLVFYFLTRYVSVASIVAGLSLPACAFFAWGAADMRFWLGLFVAAFIVVKHRSNIARLARGEENRFSKSENNGGNNNGGDGGNKP
jgi:glycerol-3-phosphate acyltransferase PlsY